MGKAGMTVISNLLLLTLSFVCAPAAFAGPPARSVLVSGEILVDGMPVPEKTELKLRLAQADVSVETKVSAAGTSYYRLVYPLKTEEAYSLQFISLGAENLTSLPPLTGTGGSVRANVLVRTAIQKEPAILAAAAAQDSDGKWLLTATIRSGTRGSDEEPLSSSVLWYLRAAAAEPDGTEPRARLAAQEILDSASAGNSSLVYAEAINEGDVFEVYVIPGTKDGKKGPAARQTVIPVLTRGGL